MPFQVEWHDDALEELAAIWLRAPDPEQVTIACAQIDHDLSANPLTIGGPAGSMLRSHVIVPLAVLYEVTQSTAHVTVVEITEWRPEFN